MTNDNPRNYKIYLYKVATTLIVVISLIFILNELGEYYDVLILPSTFKASYLTYGVISQILFLLFISYAWKYNIFVCTNKNISLRSSFSQISLVLVGKYIPGKIWGMYARSLNLRTQNISYSESLLGTYIEQLISVHSGLSFGLIAWLVAIEPVLVSPALILIILSILFSPLIQNKVFRLAARFRKKNTEDEIKIPSFELNRISYLKLFLLYLFEWVFVGLALIILYFALFDSPASYTLIFLLMGCSAFAFVAGFFAVFAPGGIGVREGVIVALLAQHIPLADSVILVLTFRVWFTLSDVLTGILGLLISEKSINDDLNNIKDN